MRRRGFLSLLAAPLLAQSQRKGRIKQGITRSVFARTDYHFDHMTWGVDVMQRVSSPRVNIQWIGHFHTGGNPGRNNIDESQELNYACVMRAIADLGFTGYVVHEYTPAQGNDPLYVLEKAIQRCDA